MKRGKKPVEVNFPDQNLEIAVRSSIGKFTGQIFESDLLGLTCLDSGHNNVINLTGIEYLTDLEELRLEDNQIIDIIPLSKLTKLKWLWLRNNQITDVNPLSGLTSLKVLWIQGNQITDFSSLDPLVERGLIISP